MWGSIKIGYKITFGPTDVSGRAEAMASARQRVQSQADDHREEIARLTTELAQAKQMRTQIAAAVAAGRGLHNEFHTWLQHRDLNPRHVESLAFESEEEESSSTAPGLPTDDVARFELLWNSLSRR